jgi:hypothetical protein
MRCFHHPETVLHQPPQFLVRGQPKPVPEKPERVGAVLDALKRRGDRVEQAPDAGPGFTLRNIWHSLKPPMRAG